MIVRSRKQHQHLWNEADIRINLEQLLMRIVEWKYVFSIVCSFYYFLLLNDELWLPKDVHVGRDPEPWPLGQLHPPVPLLGPGDGAGVHRVVAVEVSHGEAQLGGDAVGQMEDGRGAIVNEK